MTASKPSAGDASQRRAEAAQLGGERRRRDGSGRWRLRRRTSRSGTSKTAATTGIPRRRRDLDVARGAAPPPAPSSRSRSSAAAGDGGRRRDRAPRTPPCRRAGPSRPCRPSPAGGPRRSPARAGTSAPPTSTCRTLPVRRSPRGRGRGAGSPLPCRAHGTRVVQPRAPLSGETWCQRLTRKFPGSRIGTDLPQMEGRYRCRCIISVSPAAYAAPETAPNVRGIDHVVEPRPARQPQRSDEAEGDGEHRGDDAEQENGAHGERDSPNRRPSPGSSSQWRTAQSTAVPSRTDEPMHASTTGTGWSSHSLTS